MRERLLLLSNGMMSALQCIVLVATILTIMTAVSAKDIKCFAGLACTGNTIDVSCMV